MSAYTIVPSQVFKAYESGDISLRLFNILVVLYHLADFGADAPLGPGVVRSMSAERVLRYLHEPITKSSVRNMQRELRRLLDAGWFTWDYKNGSKRPYNLKLRNFPVLKKEIYGAEIEDMQNGGDADGDGENVAENVADVVLLRPYSPEVCGRWSKRNVADDVADNDGVNVPKVTPNNQYAPSGREPLHRGESTETAPPDSRLAELKALVYDLADQLPPTSDAMLQRIIDTRDFDEVKVAVKDFIDLTDHKSRSDLNRLFGQDGAGLDSVIQSIRGKKAQQQAEEQARAVRGKERAAEAAAKKKAEEQSSASA
jgi:hypothetical protein